MLRTIEDRGWPQDTDISVHNDHGELQGDFGLLYKGPPRAGTLMQTP